MCSSQPSSSLSKLTSPAWGRPVQRAEHRRAVPKVHDRARRAADRLRPERRRPVPAANLKGDNRSRLAANLDVVGRVLRRVGSPVALGQHLQILHVLACPQRPEAQQGLRAGAAHRAVVAPQELDRSRALVLAVRLFQVCPTHSLYQPEIWWGIGMQLRLEDDFLKILLHDMHKRASGSGSGRTTAESKLPRSDRAHQGSQRPPPSCIPARYMEMLMSPS